MRYKSGYSVSFSHPYKKKPFHPSVSHPFQTIEMLYYYGNLRISLTLLNVLQCSFSSFSNLSGSPDIICTSIETTLASHARFINKLEGLGSLGGCLVLCCSKEILCVCVRFVVFVAACHVALKSSTLPWLAPLLPP